MLKRLAILAAAIGLLSAPATQAEEIAAPTRGEAKLAKLLDGRVAGEASDCIRTIGSRSMTQIDDTALVYKDGDTIWVNRTRNPGSIDDSDYLVIRKFTGSQLCRSDRVTTYSRIGNFFSGVIFLDDFVPYRVADAG